MNGIALLEHKSLKIRIGMLNGNEESSDVHFIVGDAEDDSSSFHSHRAILATSSDVFKAMFYGPQAETSRDIKVTDMDPNAFARMLKYIYTDDCVLKNEEDAFETYRVADKYLISELKKKCERYLTYIKIQPQTVSRMLEKAIWLRIDSLKSRCLMYIQSKAKEVMKSQCFLNSTYRTVQSILQLEYLNVSAEDEVLELVISWAVRQQESLGDRKSLNEIMKPVLPFICFQSITCESFCSIVEKYPHVFTTEEAFALLMNYVKPGSRSTPGWYETGKTRKTSSSVRIVANLGPEILRLRVKRNVWRKKKVTSCNCGIKIKNLSQPILLYGVSIEWSASSEDLPTVVSIDHIATLDGSRVFNLVFEPAETVTDVVSESNYLQVNFQKPIVLQPVLPFWIIVRLRFIKEVTVMYLDHANEGAELFQCSFLQNDNFLPIVSQLFFSKNIPL